ncbi:MAG: lipopolysaccharide export system protein LptC [Alteromonadaceae bacterium]|jgi:lipopolysaccharide export system protein LptC
MNKLRLLLSIIFISVMTMMWVSLDDETPVPIQSNLTSAERAEYVAIDLKRIVYNQNGELTQQLTAKKMTYFDSQNRAEFDSPLLVLQTKQNNSDGSSSSSSSSDGNETSQAAGKWRISSQSGILYNNNRLILRQNVDAINLVQSDYINSITAQNISVNIKDNTMLSDDNVQIRGDDVIMTGSGLIANLNDHHIELIRHAQTIYQSDKK